ncbi:hypothetical protein [Siphonobacter sp.]
MRPKTGQEQMEWIDAYLHDALSSTERAAFEKEMISNPEFAREVEFMQQADSVIDDFLLAEMVGEIHAEKVQEWKDAEAEPAKETPVIPLHREPQQVPWWKWSAGTAAAVTIAFTSYITLSPIQVQDTLSQTLRGGDASISEQPSRICFENFYAGRSFVMTQQPSQAIPRLQQVIDCEVRPYFKDASKWYLTVAYLQANQPKEAETIYQEITENPDFSYDITWLDKQKISWQIRIAKWFGKDEA